MAGGSSVQSWGLTILRIIVGVVFLVHGYQKLFKIGFHGVAGMFGHFGIPFPLAAAIVVTLVEFVGGILLIAGIATRVAAALIAIDMIVAISVVHLKHGLTGPMGFELPLVLLAATLCLAISGGGMLALRR